VGKLTIKSYQAANGGDYDRYELSNGEVFWLWLKAPFKGGDAALVHVMSNDPTQEIGTVIIEKTNYGVVKMGFMDRGLAIEVPVTLNQELKPNKKYYFDKIVRNLLMK